MYNKEKYPDSRVQYGHPIDQKMMVEYQRMISLVSKSKIQEEFHVYLYKFEIAAAPLFFLDIFCNS